MEHHCICGSLLTKTSLCSTLLYWGKETMLLITRGNWPRTLAVPSSVQKSERFNFWAFLESIGQTPGEKFCRQIKMINKHSY